jgi:hypothetical protein
MYSALTRAAESPKFPAKQAAKSVINQLRKGHGVKQVEIDVSGLEEWLEGKDKILKTDLVNFLRASEMEVITKRKEGSEEIDDDTIHERAMEISQEYIKEIEQDLIDEAQWAINNKMEGYKEAVKEYEYDKAEYEKGHPGEEFPEDLNDYLNDYLPDYLPDSIDEDEEVDLDAIRESARNQVDLTSFYDQAREELIDELGSEFEYADESYRLPGGVEGSYREILIRVPGSKDVGYLKVQDAERKLEPLISKLHGKSPYEILSADELTEYKKLMDITLYTPHVTPAESVRYHSPHWEGEKNVVMHMRGDEHTSDTEVCFFHFAEFQSDIFGEIAELEATKAAAAKEEPVTSWRLLYPTGQELGPSYLDEEKARTEAALLNADKTVDLITVKKVVSEPLFPVHDMRKLANLRGLLPWGENWHELAAKKAIEFAVDNGFSYISWDTAHTQVDRWESALRKSVDTIQWRKIQGESLPELVFKDIENIETNKERGFVRFVIEGKTYHTFSGTFVQGTDPTAAIQKELDALNKMRARGGKGMIQITGLKDGSPVFNESIPLRGKVKISGQDATLNNLIGKELATKIRESSESKGSFEGKDLTIGGEFYKILYDQKIPGFLKRYGKKWGAKVGQDTFDGTKVHTFEITEKMRADIQAAGQALFTEKGGIADARHTVESLRSELSERLGGDAVRALEKTEKIKLLTIDKGIELTGRPDLRKIGAQGFYYGGAVYLLPENIDRGHGFNVLMHELGVHHGFKKIFGEKLAKEVFNSFALKRYNDDKLGKAIAKAFDRVPEKTPVRQMSEEAVAYFCEEHANIDLALHRKIIARMRLWAVKYFGVKPDIFTHDDYVALAASAMRGEIREAAREPVREGVSREIFYSETDIRYSEKEKKDLHTWADDLIKSAKDDKPLRGMGATKGAVTADEYVTNRETNKKVKLAAASNIRKVATEITEGVDKYLGSISTRLGQISPKLKAKMRKLDFDINTKYAKDVKLVEPLLIKAKKMSKEDFADWDYARKNSDVAKINELVDKYNMREEYEAYREVLARLRMEGIDVGMDIGEIEEYAPRILKDTGGFLTAIGKDPEWPLYTRLLGERAQELGISVAKMPADIKADIISNTILGGWSGLSGVPATKQRKLEKIPPELNQYYMDSDAALMQHLHSMRNGIEARKFFGKIPKKVARMRTRLRAAQSKIREMNELLKAELTEEETAKLERRRNKHMGLEKTYTAYIAKYATQRDYTQNIGSYVMELIDSGEISPHQEQTVNEILMARFHEAGTRGLVQDYKNLSYIDTMGSPISALTQIGDLAWAGYEGGFILGIPRTLKYAGKSLIGKAKITRKDVGVERIAQEFADSGKLGKAVTLVFKMVGLEKIDAIGKESLMMAALEKYQSQAKKNPEGLKKELKPIFEFETDSVIEDLLSDEISDNVKLLVYSRLLDFQPVGLSEMPQKYLDAGNGRLFYMLKTFTLKVFDVFRNESYYKIKNGNRGEKIRGMQNLATLAFFFVLCNVGADELKDWVLGRKTEFSDRMVDNLLRLVGVSKFVTWKARTEGVGSALARQVLPPFKFIDSVGKDIITAGDEKGLEMLGSVPVVGKLAYWHIGRGVKKREDLWNRRLRKRKAKLNKIQESFEKAENKDAFRRKHWEELKELQAVKSLQSSLNRGRIKVNKLKSEEETPARKKAIQRLEKERTEQIRDFLKSTDRAEGVADSIWSGVLGITAEMDTTQVEINRLVDTGALVQSGKPSRNINAGHGIKVKLDDDQYSRYVADTSAIIKLATDRLVARSTWQKWSDKKRAFAVKRVINKGRKIVRDRLKKTILKARINRKK